MKFLSFDIKALLCLLAFPSVFFEAPMAYPASLGAELLPFKGQVGGQYVQALRVGRLRENRPSAKAGFERMVCLPQLMRPDGPSAVPEAANSPPQLVR